MASGRIFCCSVFDLPKNKVFSRKTVTLSDIECLNTFVKVGTDVLVSLYSIIPLYNEYLNVFNVGERRSADVCPCLPEKLRIFRNEDRKKSPFNSLIKLLCIGVSLFRTYSRGMNPKLNPYLTKIVSNESLVTLVKPEILYLELCFPSQLSQSAIKKLNHTILRCVELCQTDKVRPLDTLDSISIPNLLIRVLRKLSGFSKLLGRLLERLLEQLLERQLRLSLPEGPSPIKIGPSWVLNELLTSTHPSEFLQSKLGLNPSLKKRSSKAPLHNSPRKSRETNFYNLHMHQNNLHIVKLSYRHSSEVTTQRLLKSQDVETNPGPGSGLGQHSGSHGRNNAPIRVTSLNVRGLKDESKLRHLVNHFHKPNSNKDIDLIVGLQETYLEKDGKIPYLWRGNYFVTPGNGHSSGCITLLSSHINIVESQNIGNRAHVLAVQKVGDNGITYVILNLYAPNPNSNEKIKFYNNAFDVLSEFEARYDCSNLIVIGDFNLTFDKKEMKNRMYTPQEQRVANFVKNGLNDLNLTDIWEDEFLFTWRRPNSDIFSTIDRIAYSKSHLKLSYTNVNWALSYSDHAAVEVGFARVDAPIKQRSRLTRLDPSLLKNNEYRLTVERDFNELIKNMLPDWNPHLKLEYAKMCIRTVVEKVQAECKRSEASEEETLNEELNMAIEQLAIGSAPASNLNLMDYIEELRSQKNVLINRKGERLAEKLGTKWYNEGEKSTRYFLRILNRKMPDDFKTLISNDGLVLTNEPEIEGEIRGFYKNLYENCNVTSDNNDNFFDEITPIAGESETRMVKPITVEELRRTLHTCKDSTPGPDGIPYTYLGLLWPTIGPLLCEAWEYSLRTGKLTASHKSSFLKLIPKAGKDLSKLTNWRPITLSNCDHKLITKTYANRMSEELAPSIGESQTAYIKGRLISDNIRSMISSVNVINLAERAQALMVALDAQKAFDSVEHSYIELCLSKFGCSRFIPIFRTLYKELSTDILFNGRIIKGYSIKRGVKQGDALSCIIFIMCMEPLIRNIEINRDIEPIYSNELNSNLPKAYAFADDVNAVMKRTDTGLQALFSEYERLTMLSGLKLNADKTELLEIGRRRLNQPLNVTYLNDNYEIKPTPEVRINGVFFQNDMARMIESNVDRAIERMTDQFKKWARRGLTTLGKILITKTFGISQLVYLMQCLTLNETHYKKFNHVIFKYIWNRHFLASKAPERIKRLIMNTPIKYGGFGMLEVSGLDESLKIKAFGRILITRHPMLSLIKNKTDFGNFFAPKCLSLIDPFLAKGIELVTKDRDKLWTNNAVNKSRSFLAAVGHTDLKHLVNEHGKNSVPFYMLWRNGKRLVRDLSRENLATIVRYIKPERIDIITLARNANLPNENLHNFIFRNKGFVSIEKCTSKEIRESRNSNVPITEFKIGAILSVGESLSLFHQISKLTSTRHKNILLRVMHGEIYTKEKLHRFGLIDSPLCPRCNQVENLRHKFLDCEYVAKIWREASIRFNRTQSLESANDLMTVPANPSNDLAELMTHAEILLRIIALQDNQNYLLHPKGLIVTCLKDLLKKETKAVVRNKIRALLE